MNPQLKKDKSGAVLSLGIEWCHIFGPGSGYTANAIRGCKHDCKWTMPDGAVVVCYAKAQRDRMDGEGAFENITFHPNVLLEVVRHKQPAGIFFDSMSDFLGNGVKDEWIHQCLDTVKKCPQHVFFILTKNAARLTDFSWPDNVLLGVSAPPEWINGKHMNETTRRVWYRNALIKLNETDALNKWTSIEPLSLDLAFQIQMAGEGIAWAVIGAGSDGRKYYQPDRNDLRNVMEILRINGTKIFFKGNLDKNLANEVVGRWLEEFPEIKKSPAMEQSKLL